MTKEPFRFIYVSGHGATFSPTYFTFIFGRVKGETEKGLSELRTPQFHIEPVRPAGVDATNHDAIKPYISNLVMLLNVLNVLMRLLMGTMLNSLHNPTEQLGPFLAGMVMGKYDKQLDAGGEGIANLNGSRILEDLAFRRLYQQAQTFT
jgi:hypothetical protein